MSLSCPGFPDKMPWRFGTDLKEDIRMGKVVPVDYHGSTSEHAKLFVEGIYPNPLPTQIPPASILQWAATEGFGMYKNISPHVPSAPCSKNIVIFLYHVLS